MPNALPAPVVEAMDAYRDAQFTNGAVPTMDNGQRAHAARAELEARIGEAIAATRQPREGELSRPELDAIDAFFSYGMTRGNHDGYGPGPLSDIIGAGVAMDAWNKIRAQRAAIRPAPEETP